VILADALHRLRSRAAPGIPESTAPTHASTCETGSEIVVAMALVSELDLPVFDHTDPELRGDRFHAVMRELAERGWLAQSPLACFVLDREAAEFFLRTRKAAFPGMRIAELFGIDSGPLHEEMRRNILHLHGDDHRRLRNLVNPAFTPRAADRWRPAMRGFLAELWARVEAQRGCDFVAAVAKPYPSLTIATVMGAPLADAPRLQEWSAWIQRQFDATALMTERPRIEQAVEEFYAWVGELIARRRASPEDDLISTLIAAEAEGDRLSEVECANLVLNVLVGGVDTTQSQLAHALRLFALHPEQWRALAERPELIAPAVEEVLRFEPITPFTARIMLEDVSYRGVTFPADTLVLVSTVTGNRDPAAVADPESFDVTTPRPGAKPLTFGAGVHYCLGANLARAELQEALGFLAPRLAGLALDGEPRFGTPQGIYELDALPIRW
jgi:cytochrome P450